MSRDETTDLRERLLDEIRALRSRVEELERELAESRQKLGKELAHAYTERDTAIASLAESVRVSETLAAQQEEALSAAYARGAREMRERAIEACISIGDGYYGSRGLPASRCVTAIRSLPDTPAPENLVGALQDRIHHQTGIARPAKSVRARSLPDTPEAAPK